MTENEVDWTIVLTLYGEGGKGPCSFSKAVPPESLSAGILRSAGEGDRYRIDVAPPGGGLALEREVTERLRLADVVDAALAMSQLDGARKHIYLPPATLAKIRDSLRGCPE